jgi:predicted RNase H-like nuclease (RuvC/YqgF family)
MAKKNKKREIVFSEEEFISLMNHMRYSTNVDWRSKEAEAVIDDNEFRAMVRDSMKDWMEETLNKRIDEMTAQYEKLFSKYKRILHDTEKKLTKVKYANERMRDDNARMRGDLVRLRKDYRALKKEVEAVKKILGYIGYCDGVAPIDSSLKKVRHGYKKEIKEIYDGWKYVPTPRYNRSRSHHESLDIPDIFNCNTYKEGNGNVITCVKGSDGKYVPVDEC